MRLGPWSGTSVGDRGSVHSSSLGGKKKHGGAAAAAAAGRPLVLEGRPTPEDLLALELQMEEEVHWF